MATANTEREIAEFVASCHHDPLKFVLGAYPWGEPGFLKPHDGPDTWQRDFLVWWGEEIRARNFDGVTPVAPIRAVVSSGHGIGKSVLVAMIVNFIMSTRPFSMGTCTANTITQLQTKTWASVKRWTKLCLTGHWFIINDERMYHPDHKESWFCALQNSKKENAEAFAGQHAADSTSFYVVDESSAIDDAIFETAEGGLTDGEPMIFQFGNPTRSYGHFHRCAFGAGRTRWVPTIIDSRTSRFTNKAQIAEWIEDYGIDSDFVRVRVRGLPPSASDVQYIGLNIVTEAQRRSVVLLGDEPLVVGLDVARGGEDNCVFYFRRGADVRSIPPIRIPGEKSRDSTRLVSRAAEVLDGVYNGHRVAHLFVDGTGIGGPIVDRLKQLNYKNVTEVQFAGDSPDPKLANMRAYMWMRMREWLMQRGCIPQDVYLETDLTGPGYHHNNNDQLVLESKEQMKKRGVSSPDDGDALALTFAGFVGAEAGVRAGSPKGWIPPAAGGNWMA